MKKNKKIIGVGLVTAIASSLCCIAPILTLILGASGIISIFSWLEPFRIYLIGFTILVLSLAWYQQLKPKKEVDCYCEMDEKSSFFQKNIFLVIVTLFSITMTIFPYYSSVFYPKSKKKIIVIDKTNIQTISFKIKGMSCASCEEHINYSVSQLKGIINIKSSYTNKNAEIKFDNSTTTIEEIKKTINQTGYTVIKTIEK